MLTVQKVRRIEVWSAPQCAGGARLAVLTSVQKAAASVQLGADGTLTLALPLTEAVVAQLLMHRVIRLDESDGSFDEWRIADREKSGEDGMATLTCAPCYTFLGRRGLVQRLDGLGGRLHDFDVVGMAPSAIIDTYVLPALTAAGVAWVSRGAIANDAPIDLTVSWASPWALLRQIESLTALELELVRNGTAGYVVNLQTAIASAAPVADVRFGKNLLKSGLHQTSDSQATRIYPKGASVENAHATMARAQWSVSAIAGSVVTLADPAAGDGPIGFDGQLVGAYLRTKTGALRQVTASSAANQTVTLASVVGLTVADLIQFRADAAGADLTWLDSPADVTRDGVLNATLDLSDVPATNNVLPNPVGRTWPAGTLPSGWSAVGAPTLAKQVAAPYLRTAGASIHVTATADGLGVLSPAGALSPTAAAPHGSCYADLWVVSGSVRVEMVLTTPGGTKVVPLAPAYASNSVRGQWESLGVSGIDLNALGATAVAVRVVAHQGAAEFYVDAAQHTETASQQPLVEGSGGTKLWQAANDRLRLYGAPPDSYQLSVADLSLLGIADVPFVLGGRVRITDARVVTGSFSTRVVGLERDLLANVLLGLTLSTRPDDLQGILARPVRAPRKPVGSTGDHPADETGPSLDVVSTPGTPYLITYTGVGVELSINGALPYSAAPASPITVTRPAAGGTPLEYTFRVLLNGQTLTDSVTIQPIDKDTVTPDLTLGPANATDTKIDFYNTATNPASGSAAMTLKVLIRGTTGVNLDSGAVYADGVEYVYAPTEGIRVYRPAFGTTQASVTFTASLAGGGSERIEITVLNQVRASFGPSLVVTPTPGSTSYALAYSGTYDTLLLSIDGGTYSAPAASPITVTRDGNDHTYAFKATKDGQDTPAAVTVPALVVGVPSFSSASMAISSYALDQVQASWVASNAPSGATYDIDIWEQTHATNPTIGNSTTYLGVTSPYVASSVNDLDAAGARTKAFRVYVRMKAGVTVVANAASATTTLPSNT